MRIILNGQDQTLTLQRAGSPTNCQVLNDDGSPYSLVTAGLKAVLDVSTSSTAFAANLVGSLAITPDGVLGVYGRGTLGLPSVLGLVAGTPYYGRLRVDDGSGSSGQLQALTLLTGGSGYQAPPSVTISDGVSSSGTATLALSPVGISSVVVTNGGSGFTSVPTVTQSGATPLVAATLTAVMNGTVTAGTILTGGSHYLNPTLSVSGSPGAGAVLTPNMTGGIQSIAVTTPGSGYGSAPSVTVTGTGTGCTAEADVSGGVVTRVRVTAPGSGFYGAVTVAFGGPGTLAAATATIGGSALTQGTIPGSVSASYTGVTWGVTNSSSNNVTGKLYVQYLNGVAVSATIKTPGSGYPTSTTTNFTITGPTVSSVIQVSTDGGGALTGTPTVTTAGSYTVPSLKAVTPVATGRVATFRFSKFQVDTSDFSTVIPDPTAPFTWTDIGYGYSSTPTVQDSTSTAYGPTFSLGLTTAALYSVNVITGGSGYPLNVFPTVSTSCTVSGSPVPGSVGLTLTGSVGSVTVTSAGSGYRDVPVLAFTGGGGVGAAATVLLSASVASLALNSPGSGYFGKPLVTFTGGNPSTPATATATAIQGATTTGANTLNLTVI